MNRNLSSESAAASAEDSGTFPSAIDNRPSVFSLDVLRGLALFGLLFISIREFSGFSFNEQVLFHKGTHGGNYKLMTAISFLFEGKMIALFAIVFGAGILLFLQKKEYPVQISSADAYIRRQLWLIAFGLVNAFILLWPGDILFQFGVIGILLFAFTRMRSNGFFIAAILCTLIYCGKQYWNYADDKKDYKKYTAVTLVEKKFKADSTARAQKDSLDRTKDTLQLKEVLAANKMADSLARKNDTLTKEQAEEKGKWEGILKNFKYDTAKTKGEKKAMWGGYTKVWDHIMPQSQHKESSWLYKIGIWDIGSMLFLGMALLSIGFFSSRFSSSKYLLIAAVVLIAGFALAWLRICYDAARITDYTKYITGNTIPYNFFLPIERMLVATGYAALVLWLLRLKVLNWLWKAMAATGQMALTNYFLQTIICTFLFYGYGFGYFGRLSQIELYFMITEIILVQTVFSVLWLRYFEMGPMEWIWSYLVYRKRLPFKKPETE